jgi:hypothetical protein
LHDSTSTYQQSILYQTPEAPIDGNYLSIHSFYNQYSNSPSPSGSYTPIDPSDSGGYSPYSGGFEDINNSFGVEIDLGNQLFDTDQFDIVDIPLPTTELSLVDQYLPQAQDSRTPASDLSIRTTYPVTPNQTISPRSPAQQSSQPTPLKTNIPQPVHSDGMNSSSPSTMSFNLSIHTANLQQTPDRSGSSHTSHTSPEGIAPGMSGLPANSPRVMVTQWGGSGSEDISGDLDASKSLSDHKVEYFEDKRPQSAITTAGSPRIDQANINAFGDDASSGRSGIDPLRRRAVSDAQIPSLKDAAEMRRLEDKNSEILEWRSQAGSQTGDSSDETPQQSYLSIGVPATSRARALSTGAIPRNNNYPHGFNTPQLGQNPSTQSTMVDDQEGKDIETVSETASIRENRLQEGIPYINNKTSGITSRDADLIAKARFPWNDSPALPFTVKPSNPAENGMTANDAIREFNQNADRFSMLSRSATWGTRRKSEPSFADIEDIKSGGLLKRLSFGRTGDKKPGIGGFFNNLTTNIVRKKSQSGQSDANKLKRGRGGTLERGRPDLSPAGRKDSQANLTIPQRSPSGNRRLPSPGRLTTNLNSNPSTPNPGHNRQNSLSATSPRSTAGSFFNNVNNALRRARSRSDLGSDEPSGLYGMLAKHGGPPAPIPSPHPDSDENQYDDQKIQDNSDMDGDEDEDEDLGDDGDLKMDIDPDTPIDPTLAGFQEHVMRLNPSMQPGYLVERLAYQQVTRYKSLLQWRVKHSGVLRDGNCPSHELCKQNGGSPRYFDSRGNRRNNSVGNRLQVPGEGSDGEISLEGQLTLESFPDGVPMPPATSLPAEFECQLCFKVKKFNKPSDWTKHVHEDVQPFTCTYQNCREPKSFKRKADWVRHENERHRHLEWWQCEIDDCPHKCYRKDNFLQHLVREHKLPEPKVKSKAAVKKARGMEEEVWKKVKQCHHETIAKPQDEPCKFCGKVFTTWKKLTVHLGKHMEQISLPVLALVEKREVDASTMISPVEPLPHRHVPVTPISMNRQASSGSSSNPYHSQSISPNAPQMSQFPSPLDQQNMANMSTMPQYADAVYAMNFNNTVQGQNIQYNNMRAANQLFRQQDNMIPVTKHTSYQTMHQRHPSNESANVFGLMSHSPLVENPTQNTFLPQTQTYQNTLDINQVPFPSFTSSTTTLVQTQPQYATTPISNFLPQQRMTPEPYLSAPQQIPNYPAHDMLGLQVQNPISGFGYETLEPPEMGYGLSATGENSPYSSSPQGMLGDGADFRHSNQRNPIRRPSGNAQTYPGPSHGSYGFGN